MTADRAQDLFERMADEWPGEAPLELLQRKGRVLTLRAPSPGDLPGRRFRMEVLSLPSVPEVAELVLVQRLGRTPLGRWFPDGPAVHVSPIPSAILAVALR